MSDIKCVSFDFWNTLAIPNPTYAEERAIYLEAYNLTSTDYHFTKQMIDKMAKNYGYGGSVRDNICLLLRDCNSGFNQSDRITIVDKIKSDLVNYFYDNPPTFSNEVEAAIEFLTEKDIKWGVTSNTNFISGEILDTLICSKLNTKNYVGGIFSDLYGKSKPHPDIFNAFSIKSETPLKNILHIGDDLTCDFFGSMMADVGKSVYLTKGDNIFTEILREL